MTFRSQRAKRAGSRLGSTRDRAGHECHLFTTTVNQAEILYGLKLMPSTRRRNLLQAAIADMFANDLAGRILSFDHAAAQAYAEIAAARRKAGRPIAQFDAQIAAIAWSRDASVATRNATDFEGCGIGVIDPWREP